MSAYGTSRTARTAVLPYDGVMRHPLTEGHTGLPEMGCPLITSEHSSRISREESHDFNRGRSQNFVLACIISQKKSIKRIEQNVFTDDEHISYNSIVYQD